MKCLRFIPIVLTAVCIFPAAAQQPDTQQPQPQQSAPPPQTGQGGEAAAPTAPEPLQLAPVTAELTSKLDSRTAKAGDSVVLKTTEKTTMADGTVIPKGSKIVGHVTEAQPFVANSDNGRLTLQFDQAEIRGGQTVPIKSALQTVSPAGGASADANSGMPMGAAPSGTSASGSSPSRTGASSTGSSGSTTSSSAQQAPSPGMAGSGEQSTGPAPGTTVARNGNVVIKTTAVPGVLVASSINGQPFSNASGALLSARQDVRLDGGTKMVLALASSGPGNPR